MMLEGFCILLMYINLDIFKIMCKVSIIVPNYNHKLYIKKRLDSILNQTYNNYEIIILDDCSNDDSVGIMKAYKDHEKVSSFIINKVNSGTPFKQWKKGIELAKGEYIWIAESDDFAHPDFLSQAVQVLDSYEHVGLVSVSSHLVDEEDNRLGVDTQSMLIDKSSRMYNSTDSIVVVPSQAFIKGYFLGESSIYNASGVLFKKAFLLGSENGFENKKQLGDVFFWGRILINNGDVAFLKCNLNYFRIHKKSTTVINRNEHRGVVIYEEYQFLNYLYNNSKDFIDSSIKNKGFNRLALKYVKYKWTLGKCSIFIFDKVFTEEMLKNDKKAIIRIFTTYLKFVISKIKSKF